MCALDSPHNQKRHPDAFGAGAYGRYTTMEWIMKLSQLAAARFFAIAFTCLISDSAVAGDDEADRWSTSRGGLIDGNLYSFVINEQDCKTAWKPGNKLPVGLDDIVRRAKKEFSRYAETPEKYAIRKFELERVGFSDSWFYSLDFVEKYRGERSSLDSFGVFVCIDGTPIEGRRDN